jgi:hypothetical protein
MIRALLALVLLLPLAPQSSEAFVFRKIVYCSPIEGFVHWKGKPLANVVATRELHSGGLDGGKYSDTATTGTDGRFQFGVVEERRLFRPNLLSANPHVNQLLTVNFDGHRYLIWTFMKHDFQLGTEAVNGNLRLDCDLSKFEEGASARIVQCQSNGVVRKYE